MSGRRLLTGLVVLAAAWTAPLAAASPSEPWAREPAFPTSCYQESDDFDQRLTAAREAVEGDRDLQRNLNQKLSDQLKEIDPMELASRQQQYMMDHPQEAMALMQRNLDVGQEGTAAALRNNEDRERLVQELEEIDTRYRAALDAQVGPFVAKFKDLDARAQEDLVGVGEMWAYAPWAVKEFNELTRQENAAYEKVCAEWWAASGPFHGWMRRLKDNLVERIPHREEADNVGAGFMVIMISTPEASYKSTATLDAINEHMNEASRVFAKRRPRPNPVMEQPGN